MEVSKSRHFVLTALLSFYLIAHATVAIYCLLAGESLRELLPMIQTWLLPALFVSSTSAVGFLIALFRWKKWGFWGFCISNIASALASIQAGFSASQFVSALVGILLLSIALRVGSENKGWPQLE